MKRSSWALSGIIVSILFYILEIIYLWMVGRIVSMKNINLIQVLTATWSLEVIYWTLVIIIVGFLVGAIIGWIRRK